MAVRLKYKKAGNSFDKADSTIKPKACIWPLAFAIGKQISINLLAWKSTFIPKIALKGLIKESNIDFLKV